jgi:hypothetical protein
MTDHADVILANGQSTGALLLPTPGGHLKLQVKRGRMGRGLFAARDVLRNEIIATIVGYVAPEAVDGFECWGLAQNKFFVMEPSSRQHLGTLANTAAGSSHNNARYVFCRSNPKQMQLRAIKRIQKGVEILAPYGKGYAAVIKKRVVEHQVATAVYIQSIEDTAPIRYRAGAARVMLCAKCGNRVTDSIRINHARMCKGTQHL